MSSRRYVLRKVPATQEKQWDQFVNQHPQGHFLQSWGWGELKASGGWYPLRLALWDERRIVAAAQVLCRTATRLPLWTGHLAYIPRGPVIDWSQQVLCQSFFTQLNAYLHKHGALALRIEPNREVKVFEEIPQSEDNSVRASMVEEAQLGDDEAPLAHPAWGTGSSLPLQLYPVPPIQPLRTILLDLTLHEATLLAKMKEKWRYNLRLAERKGVKVRVAQTLEDVQAWYVLMQTTSERDQFGIHIADYYLQAWRIFVPRQQARLFLAEYNGQLLAGIFVGLFAHQAIYLYGASSNEHRNLMPNYLLQWEAIRWAKQQGARQYDFWGIPKTDNEDEALAGVYRFKRGWGGQIVRFVGCHEHIYRPAAMKMVKRVIP